MQETEKWSYEEKAEFSMEQNDNGSVLLSRALG